MTGGMLTIHGQAYLNYVEVISKWSKYIAEYIIHRP